MIVICWVGWSKLHTFLKITPSCWFSLKTFIHSKLGKYQKMEKKLLFKGGSEPPLLVYYIALEQHYMISLRILYCLLRTAPMPFLLSFLCCVHQNTVCKYSWGRGKVAAQSTYVLWQLPMQPLIYDSCLKVYLQNSRNLYINTWIERNASWVFCRAALVPLIIQCGKWPIGYLVHSKKPTKCYDRHAKILQALWDM